MKKNLKTLFVANLVMAGAIVGNISNIDTIGAEVVYASEVSYTAKAVNVGHLNVRAGASKNSKILGVITKGEIINITDVVYGWNKFTYNGQTAYVDGGFLTTNLPTATTTEKVTTPVVAEVKAEATFTPVSKVVNVHSVNFRSGASNNASIISVLKEGQVFTVIDNVYGWNKIVVDGKEGYVYGRYLTEVAGVQSTIIEEVVVVETPVIEEVVVVETPVVEEVVVVETELIEEFEAIEEELELTEEVEAIEEEAELTEEVEAIEEEAELTEEVEAIEEETELTEEVEAIEEETELTEEVEAVEEELELTEEVEAIEEELELAEEESDLI